MTETNPTDAYHKGWQASRRTTTGDLDAAETRFLRRYGHECHRAFVDGWTDHAAGNGYNAPTPAHLIEEAAPMTTKIRWERGVAGQVAAHLLSDDGGHALVHCMIPGGRPRFMPRPDAQWDTSIVDAPACDTFAAFKRFVRERFGDDQEAGRANLATASILFAVAATGVAMLAPMMERVTAMLGGAS